MYTYAGYNEFGYLVLIEEIVIPIIGEATGSGRRSKRRYNTIELEYNLDAITVKTVKIGKSVQSKCYSNVSKNYILVSKQSSLISSLFNLTGIPTKTEELDYKIKSISFSPIIIDQDIYAVGTLPVQYKYKLISLDKLLRESVFEISGINYNPIQLIGILESSCSQTQELAYEIKGRTNLESLLAVLRMEV